MKAEFHAFGSTTETQNFAKLSMGVEMVELLQLFCFLGIAACRDAQTWQPHCPCGESPNVVDSRIVLGVPVLSDCLGSKYDWLHV